MAFSFGKNQTALHSNIDLNPGRELAEHPKFEKTYKRNISFQKLHRALNLVSENDEFILKFNLKRLKLRLNSKSMTLGKSMTFRLQYIL